MDGQEARAAVKDLVQRWTPRLPNEREAAFVNEAARSGEPGVALSELVAALVDERIAVEPADRDRFRLLLERYGERAAEVENLVTEPGGA